MRRTPVAKAHGLSVHAIHGFALAMLGLPALVGVGVALVPFLQQSLNDNVEVAPVQGFAMSTPAPLQFPPDRDNESLMALDSMITMPWRASTLSQRLADGSSLIQNRFSDMEQQPAAPSPLEFAALDRPLSLDAPTIDMATSYGVMIPPADMADEADVPLDNVAAYDETPTGSLGGIGGEAVVGRASAEDGRTLNVSGSKIRLLGLGLPEKGKKCVLLSGEVQECREAALGQLEQLLKFRNVSCTVEGILGTEKAGRCRIGDTDVAEWLVRRGWGQTEGKNGGTYTKALIFAQNFKLGLWR